MPKIDTLIKISDFFLDDLAISSDIKTKKGLYVPLYFINLFYYSKVFRYDFIRLWDSNLMDKCFIRKFAKHNTMPFSNKTISVDLRKYGHKSIFVEPYVFCFFLIHLYKDIGYKELPIELEQLYTRFQYLDTKFIPYYSEDD